MGEIEVKYLRKIYIPWDVLDAIRRRDRPMAIAKQLGVSWSTIYAAIGQLISLGLVDASPIQSKRNLNPKRNRKTFKLTKKGEIIHAYFRHVIEEQGDGVFVKQ